MMASPEPTNEWRADRAGLAVNAYIDVDTAGYIHNEDDLTHLGDLLCDLQHWAAANGVDFERAMLNGTSNFEAEVAEEND
jgi:hypothetical protein